MTYNIQEKMLPAALLLSVLSAPQAKANDETTLLKERYQQALPNIQEFSELVHRVRYFYPNAANSETQWDYFLRHSIREMVKQPEALQLSFALQQLKTVTPLLTTNQSSLPVPGVTDSVNTWYNFGARDYRFYTRRLISGDYQTLSNEGFFPPTPVYTDRYDGIPLYWPLYLPREQANSGSAYTQQEEQVSLEDPATCMAALSSIWAELTHFWPYFEQVDVDWANSHPRLLGACLKDSQRRTHIMRQTFTKLQDNHLWIGQPKQYRDVQGYSLPISLDYIDDKVIVTNRTPYLTLQVNIGDELLAIEGTDARQLVNSLKDITFTSEHIANSAAARSLPFMYGEPKLIDLTFRTTQGRVINTTTASIHRDVMGPYDRDDTYGPLLRHLDNGVVVFRAVDVTTQEQLQQARDVLQNAQAIVLDMRGYPSNLWFTRSALSLFTDRYTRTGPFVIETQRLPNRALPYQEDIPLTLEDTPKLIDAPVVALSDRTNISAGEHVLQWIQAMNIPIVGEVTMGINGDIMTGSVFGGFQNGGISYKYTGLRADQLNGDKLIGVGIQPDVKVSQTQASIAQKDDIILRKALEVLEQL
ncbi:hypothetical protein CWB99_15310 [Pseudoalteromonas rubra]|uniref:Tail specific protease domain-containing protein n=1 Tax=Pseudoalteromonas rubra TaxID=43658 RepID=A0A5S3WKW0_9GAMM|nr:S41 family peptidase [Pseudoalteromonas rubra]TMP27364.1 hypothetical protein CWB99_15310 [Pseudoalteromonas rubra]TMP36902.1 hypothetical protein CWC00_01195 [Pseudoalteromonas rubra]